MKKLILLLACCITGIATGVSQTSVIVSEQNIHGKTLSTVIREYRYPQTITCVNSSDTTATFVLSNQNMQTLEISVKNIYVNDIQICFDTVFFCGHTCSGSTDAIIGFLDVNEAFFGSGTVYIHTGFYIGNKVVVKDLTKMVAYLNKSLQRHIYCIGIGENKKEFEILPCLVDFTSEDMMGYTICGYEAGYVDDPTESFSDITIVSGNVKDFLVTTGTTVFTNKYMNIRVYDADDIFSSTGIQDIRHIYCIDTSFAEPWVSNDVLVTAVEPNVFMTASLQRNTDPLYYGKGLSERCHLHIAKYDLISLLGGSLSSMTGNIRLHSEAYDNISLKEFICKWNTKTLCLLKNYSILSQFIEFDYSPSNTVSTIRYYLDMENSLSSLSLYNSINYYSQYVMSGNSKDFAGVIRYHMETFFAEPFCSRIYFPDKYTPNPLRSVNNERKFETLFGRASFQPYETELYEVPLTTICVDGEQEFNQTNNNQ